LGSKDDENINVYCHKNLNFFLYRMIPVSVSAATTKWKPQRTKWRASGCDVLDSRWAVLFWLGTELSTQLLHGQERDLSVFELQIRCIR
jgi:hypothetical protein